MLRDRISAAISAGRPVNAAWLRRLDALADADDPNETLLHTLALDAACDAVIAAVASSDLTTATLHLRSAFRRWRRHPELGACAELFVTTALATSDAAAVAAAPMVACESACLAGIVVSRTQPTNLLPGTRQRLQACQDAPSAMSKLRAALQITTDEEIGLAELMHADRMQ
jgi:hypothetical protein